MSAFTIINGCNIPLNTQQGSIPNMGDALLDWFQQQVFGLITKTTEGFQVNEAVSDINFWGIIQPLSGRQLAIKPEGQRMWNWISVYAQAAPEGAGLKLDPDDLIVYLGTQYRVMSQKNYANYSYVYYELVEDYSGSVPTP